MNKRAWVGRWRLLAVAVFLMLISATALAQADSQVRFVHVFPDAPNIDVYIGEDVVAEDVAYGQATAYLPVAAGDVAVAVTATGESDELFSQTVTAGADPLTLVVSGEDGFLPYIDNIDPLDLGEARVTAIHAINEGPTVDVILEDGRPVVPGLEYGVPFGTLDLPIIKLPLNVVPTGAEPDAALFAEAITLNPVTGTSYAVVVYGTVEAPEVLVLSTPVTPAAGDGLLEIVHDAPDAPAVDVYAGDLLVLVGLQPEASTGLVPVTAGTYELQVAPTDTVDIVVSAEVEVAEGSTNTATVTLDGDELVIETSSEMAVEMAAAEATEETTSAEEPTPVVAEEVVAAPTEAEVAAQPTAAPVGAVEPTAQVVGLDPGANLQLRQFPDSSSLSLGRIPAGATVTVNGREGAPVQIEGLFSEELQDEIDNFFDPVDELDEGEDLTPGEAWLNVTYDTPDGGTITAWVLASFLDVNLPDGRPQRLANLPTIPANAFGESSDTEITAPTVTEDGVVAEVFNLNPGVNLNIRRTPSIDGEVLGQVVLGTEMEFVGFGIGDSELPGVDAADDAEWVFVRYTSAEGAEITGWTSTTYTRFLFRGETVDFQELEDRDLLLFEDLDTRGEQGAGAAAVARPTVDPLRNQAVAQVTLDPGANLQFRRQPNANSESLGQIPSGTQLVVSARNEAGDWLLVEYDGETGWVATDFVRVTFNGQVLDIDELLVDDAG